MATLCPKCQHIIDRAIAYSDRAEDQNALLETVPFHTPSELLLSAKSGCPLCQNIQKQYEQFDKAEESASVDKSMNMVCDILIEPLQLWFKLASGTWGYLIPARVMLTRIESDFTSDLAG